MVDNIVELVTADNRDKREHKFLVQSMRQTNHREYLELPCCYLLVRPSNAYAHYKRGNMKQCCDCGIIVHTDCKANTHNHDHNRNVTTSALNQTRDNAEGKLF